MLIEEMRNIKSGRKELRDFGLIMGGALILFGGLLWWRGKEYYTYLFIGAAVFALLGMGLPSLLKPVYKAWMALAVILGWFMTRVILSILFYLVFTPVKFIARLAGGQFLDLKIDSSQNSYWHYREQKKIEKSNYENQY